MQQRGCLICNGTECILVSGSNRIEVYDCVACGKYSIDQDTVDDFLVSAGPEYKKFTRPKRAAMSYYLRKNYDQKSRDNASLIESDYLRKFIDKEVTGPTPLEQSNNLIRFIGGFVSDEGKDLSSFPAGSHAKVGCIDKHAMEDLCRELETKSRVKIKSKTPQGAHGINLTLDGWEIYDRLVRGVIAGSYGFMAMKFGDAELDRLLNSTIKPLIKESLGYTINTMLDVAQAGIIDNIMREQIRGAAFVLADLTHDNAGAYWEAGMAEGLSKPVIYLCKREKFENAKTHFDTNHCTTVVWDMDPNYIGRFKADLVATVHRSLLALPY